jgi:hypothetical protein
LTVFTSLVVDVFKVEGVDVTGDVSQQGEEDVDTQIKATARDQEDAEWRNEDLPVRLDLEEKVP